MTRIFCVIFLLSFNICLSVVFGAYTPITPENYAFAESQIIFKDYKDTNAAGTGTNGVGHLMTIGIMDPASRTIVRPNFDTIYSFAVLDLTEPVTLVMPETNGRYQSAMIVTEEAYTPFTINESGRYEITKENTGSNYIYLAIRTSVNTKIEEDTAVAMDLIDQLELIQSSVGDYNPVEEYDMDQLLAMRDYYLKIVQKKSYKSGDMFGPKGTMSLEEHNAGTAYGWGGLTEDQAVYLTYFMPDATPGTLTLKDVPIAENAFWSITVYDKESFATGENYNINSLFAVPNSEGEYVIHFGGDKNSDNYLDIYEDWNYTFRLYLPQEEFFDGKWEVPEFVATEETTNLRK